MSSSDAVTTPGSDASARPALDEKRREAQVLLRYALIFINFTLIVASLLLIMAGVVVRTNAAIKLCTRCGDVATVSIFFGCALWLLATFGFNWIRQRNILLLLVYVGFVLLICLVIVAVLIAAGVYNGQMTQLLNDWEAGATQGFLDMWKSRVTVNNGTDLCDLELRFNCTGFVYGCCLPYVNESSGYCYGGPEDNYTTPAWVADVCPTACPRFADMSNHTCTAIVFRTVRRNLGGFVVIVCGAFFLVVTSIWLAALVRRLGQPHHSNQAGASDADAGYPAAGSDASLPFSFVPRSS